VCSVLISMRACHTPAFCRRRRYTSAESWSGAESCNFPTKEIIGAQNFNFASKFTQNGGFKSQIMHFGGTHSNNKTAHKLNPSRKKNNRLITPVRGPFIPLQHLQQGVPHTSLFSPLLFLPPPFIRKLNNKRQR